MMPMPDAYNQGKLINQASGGILQNIQKVYMNVRFKMARNRLDSLEGLEAYLIRGKKYFSID